MHAEKVIHNRVVSLFPFLKAKEIPVDVRKVKLLLMQILHSIYSEVNLEAKCESLQPLTESDMKSLFRWALLGRRLRVRRIFMTCQILSLNRIKGHFRDNFFQYLDYQNFNAAPEYLERVAFLCGILQDFNLFSFESYLQYNIARGDLDAVSLEV